MIGDLGDHADHVLCLPMHPGVLVAKPLVQGWSALCSAGGTLWLGLQGARALHDRGDARALRRRPSPSLAETPEPEPCGDACARALRRRLRPSLAEMPAPEPCGDACARALRRRLRPYICYSPYMYTDSCRTISVAPGNPSSGHNRGGQKAPAPSQSAHKASRSPTKPSIAFATCPSRMARSPGNSQQGRP
jgi:hypothetical protein